MKIFEINDQFRCRFHLILSEKKYERYSKLIKEHGGEVVSTPQEDVYTFTSENTRTYMQDTYQVKYITDCIEKGELLDLIDYAWDLRVNYGCAQSLLLFGNRSCESYKFFQSFGNRSSAPSPNVPSPKTSSIRTSPPRISPEISPRSSRRISPLRNDSVYEICQPSTSRWMKPEKTVKTPAKSRKAKSSESSQTLKKPGINLSEPTILKTLEKRGSENPLIRKPVEKGKENLKNPDPKEMKERERQQERMEQERRERKQKERERVFEKTEHERKRRLEIEQRQEKEEQEKEQKETEDQGKSKQAIKTVRSTRKSSQNLIQSVRVVCRKINYLKYKDSAPESESNSETSFDKLQTQTNSEIRKDTPSNRNYSSDELDENLPLVKRLKKDHPSKNETLAENKISFQSDDPQGRGDCQPSQDSILTERSSLRLLNELHISPPSTPNPCISSQDSSWFAEGPTVLTQKPTRDSSDEPVGSEEFMTEDEFIDQARLEDEQIEEISWTQTQDPTIATQVPMEVDEMVGVLNSKINSSGNKDLWDELVEDLKSVPQSLSPETEMNSQVEIQRGISKRIEDQDKLQDEIQTDQNRDKIQQRGNHGDSQQPEEEPSPLLDQEDIQLLQDDSETDFETSANIDLPMIKKPVDPDIKIILTQVKDEPIEELSHSLPVEDNIPNEDIEMVGIKENVNNEDPKEQPLSPLNNIENLMQRIPNTSCGTKKKPVEEDNDNEVYSDAETIHLSSREVHVRQELTTSNNNQEPGNENTERLKYMKKYWANFAASDSESPDFFDDPMQKIADKENVEGEKKKN